MRSFVRAFGALSLAISALALSATSARAGVVLSNDFEDPAGFTLNITNTNSFATGFTTGANASFLDLTGVRLSLKTSSTSSAPVISIFSNTVTGVGDVPGTLLATLTGPGPITNTLGAQDFLFTGNLSLSPNTNYWVVLSASDPTSRYQWEFANTTPAEQNSSGYAFIAGRRKINAAAWTDNATASLGMVEIQAVPEPSTLILAGIGMAGAVAVDSKRRQRRRRMVAETSAETETL
jgi:hypothetical protein